MDITFDFYVSLAEKDPGPSGYLLVLTPEMAQKILGSPDSIIVSSPRDDGEYGLDYTYQRGRYWFRIGFLAPGEADNAILRHEYRHHSREQRSQERKRRKLFENHKAYLAGGMRLSREY